MYTYNCTASYIYIYIYYAYVYTQAEPAPASLFGLRPRRLRYSTAKLPFGFKVRSLKSAL